MLQVTTLGILINAKKAELEEKLKCCDDIDEFDIEELDKTDQIKDVMVSFKNPVELKYVSESLASALGDIIANNVVE